jgi:transposase
MLTAMTEEDWTIVLRVFAASRWRRGDKGRNDRKFLEALHYFVVHNITWQALPEKFGHWNSVWKRFWRLSRSGTFEAFFDALAAMSETAHLVQMFDSTVVRAADQCDEPAAPHGAHPTAISSLLHPVNRKLDVTSPRCFPQCIKLRRRCRVSIGEGRHAATAPSSPLDRDRRETK